MLAKLYMLPLTKCIINLMCHKTLLTGSNQGEYLLILFDMSLTHVGL